MLPQSASTVWREAETAKSRFFHCRWPYGRQLREQDWIEVIAAAVGLLLAIPLLWCLPSFRWLGWLSSVAKLVAVVGIPILGAAVGMVVVQPYLRRARKGNVPPQYWGDGPHWTLSDDEEWLFNRSYESDVRVCGSTEDLWRRTLPRVLHEGGVPKSFWEEPWTGARLKHLWERVESVCRRTKMPLGQEEGRLLRKAAEILPPKWLEACSNLDELRTAVTRAQDAFDLAEREMHRCSYGVVFGVKDLYNMLKFWVNTEGYCWLGVLRKGTWSSLIEWVQSSSIRRGYAINKLRVSRAEGTLRLSVNGNEIAKNLNQGDIDGAVGFSIGGRGRVVIRHLCVQTAGRTFEDHFQDNRNGWFISPWVPDPGDNAAFRHGNYTLEGCREDGGFTVWVGTGRVCAHEDFTIDASIERINLGEEDAKLHRIVEMADVFLTDPVLAGCRELLGWFVQNGGVWDDLRKLQETGQPVTAEVLRVAAGKGMLKTVLGYMRDGVFMPAQVIAAVQSEEALETVVRLWKLCHRKPDLAKTTADELLHMAYFVSEHGGTRADDVRGVVYNTIWKCIRRGADLRPPFDSWEATCTGCRRVQRVSSLHACDKCSAIYCDDCFAEYEATLLVFYYYCFIEPWDLIPAQDRARIEWHLACLKAQAMDGHPLARRDWLEAERDVRSLQHGAEREGHWEEKTVKYWLCSECDRKMHGAALEQWVREKRDRFYQYQNPHSKFEGIRRVRGPSLRQ